MSCFSFVVHPFDRFLLIRLRSKIFDIAMCIVNDNYMIYLGDNLKHSLGHTALLGAVFLLICDIIGRLVIYPYEVSIGLTVGIIGSAVFLYMLMRRDSNASA